MRYGGEIGAPYIVSGGWSNNDRICMHSNDFSDEKLYKFIGEKVRTEVPMLPIHVFGTHLPSVAAGAGEWAIVCHFECNTLLLFAHMHHVHLQ